MPEIRLDPVTGRQVIIAEDRSRRPTDLKEAKEDKSDIEESVKTCPFCPGNEEETPPQLVQIPENDKWQVRVIPNKFPALTMESSIVDTESRLFRRENGVGYHEVIVDNRKHNSSFFNMTSEEISYVIMAYRDRYNALSKDNILKYISIFKNYKKKAGASLEHNHSQIIASSMIPNLINEELMGSRDYYDKEGSCVFCDIISEETSYKERLVAENDSFIAITPFASKYSYEVSILPKYHASSFKKIKEDDIRQLSLIIKSVFSKLYKILGDFPFNMYIHTSPENQDIHKKSYHWHIEIVPRTFNLAGFEFGSGAYINSNIPEEVAKQLRKY